MSVKGLYTNHFYQKNNISKKDESRGSELPFGEKLKKADAVIQKLQKEHQEACEIMVKYEPYFSGKNDSLQNRRQMFSFTLAMCEDRIAGIKALETLPVELMHIYLQASVMNTPMGKKIIIQQAKASELSCKEVETYLRQEGISHEDQVMCNEYLQAIQSQNILLIVKLQHHLPVKLQRKIQQINSDLLKQTFGN